ncbi:hypothetical protein FPRO04_10318 [Fusarium proliferatum]|nr:hypothetical protein FPRO04_10318 [Fusarium proliferatum]
MTSLLAPAPFQIPGAAGQKAKQASLFSELTADQRREILKQRASGVVGVPALHFNTVKYRRGPSQQAKDDFRKRMLSGLQQHWADPDTKTRFLKLAELVETEGCALFGGLIDVSKFQKLIEDYETIQKKTGSQNFLHSYVNLSDSPSFIKNAQYNDAFVHPLLISLIAYQMGGAIRIIDMRGKDTEPLSANAQDNMLHVDNTPFKDEHKILLVWKQGQVAGPSGQNFTFLPGTHRGNREIHLDACGTPFSTEKHNLFGTQEAIDGLFDFQKQAIGQGPTVIEVEHPEQPLSMLFSAGGLVHHRYRNEYGDARSCMSAAFHLARDNPGALLRESDGDSKPKTLVEFLTGHQDSNSDEAFLFVLLSEAGRVESKLTEIDNATGISKLVPTSGMSLSEEQLHAWRDVVVSAPLASHVKFSYDVFVSEALGLEDEFLIQAIVSAMMYDKHGLLQLILYEDGHEEIRKLCRKRIGEMRENEIASRLAKYLAGLSQKAFSLQDLPPAAYVRQLAEQVASAGATRLKTLQMVQGEDADMVMLMSLVQMMMDLAEAIVRCERLETYASTSLYLFWALHIHFSSTYHDITLPSRMRHEQHQPTHPFFLFWLDDLPPHFSSSAQSISKKRSLSDANLPISPPLSLDRGADSTIDGTLVRKRKLGVVPFLAAQTDSDGIDASEIIVEDDNDEISRPDRSVTDTGSSQRSSGTVKQLSPKKVMSKLSVTPNGLMQKPLKASDPLVPKSLVQLEKEMESIADGHGVVPEYLQAEMCDKTIDDCDFTTGMFDKNAAKYSDSHREVNLYDIIAIMASANNCQEDLLDEHTWNNHVHTPLLNAAFYGKYPCPPQLDGFLTCTTATILPEYKIKAAPGKKVDYVAYINPDNDKAHPNARAIIDKYRANFAEDSINHTGYRKVTPISFSIETKRSGQDVQKAQLQLGNLSFIPGIIVEGHQWRFVASTYVGGKTIFWKMDRPFGSTGKLFPTFRIIAGIRRLRTWSSQVFWPWYTEFVLNPKPAPTTS